MSKGIFSALCAAAVCAASSAASAQDLAAQETGAIEPTAPAATTASTPSRSSIRPGKLRILGGFHMSGGGKLRNDPDQRLLPTTEDSLKVGGGLQAGVDYVVMDYFAIGGEFRLSWFNTDDYATGDIGPSLFVDFDVKPRGRYVFNSIPLEVYGTMPLGLSIAALNGDIDDALGGVDAKGGAGFNLGFGPGATYFFTDKIGINTEMLAIWHWFGTEVETQFGTGGEASNRTAQFYWFVNFVYAL